MGNEVFFEVWDKDRLSKDDLMGKVTKEIIFSDTPLNCPDSRPRSCSTLSCSLWQSLELSSVFPLPRNKPSHFCQWACYFPCREFFWILHLPRNNQSSIFLAGNSFESSPCQEILLSVNWLFSFQETLMHLSLSLSLHSFTRKTTLAGK